MASRHRFASALARSRERLRVWAQPKGRIQRTGRSRSERNRRIPLISPRRRCASGDPRARRHPGSCLQQIRHELERMLRPSRDHRPGRRGQVARGAGPVAHDGRRWRRTGPEPRLDGPRAAFAGPARVCARHIFDRVLRGDGGGRPPLSHPGRHRWERPERLAMGRRAAPGGRHAPDSTPPTTPRSRRDSPLAGARSPAHAGRSRSATP